LSIKIAEAHKICKLCDNYRAQRYCPRKGKDICWICCNGMRTDRKCPNECAYIIQEEGTTIFTEIPKKAKVDSIKELSDLTKRFFDIWCATPAESFAGQIPLELTETKEGKQSLINYLSAVREYLILPKRYLEKKLKIEFTNNNDLNEQTAKAKENLRNQIEYEKVAENYIDSLIAHDWNESIKYLYGKDKYNEELYNNNYISRRQNNRLLKMISNHHLLISAISENRKEALVYFEINNKYDLTVTLGIKESKWLVKELIIGSPTFYYGEREAIILISGYISQQEMTKAKQYLDKYQEILIDSPDLHYLNGLYYLLMKDYATALAHYLTAVELDPEFYEYKYNLALVYQMLQKYEIAKKLYQELLQKKNDDINVLNNLSVIYEAEGKQEDALQLLEKCLEIDPQSELAQKNIDRIKGQTKS